MQICRPKFAVMPQMPIFEKKGLNRKIKATTFGDEQGETEDWNKETRRLYNIEVFRKISSTICLGYPHWIKRSKNKALVQLKSASQLHVTMYLQISARIQELKTPRWWAECTGRYLKRFVGLKWVLHTTLLWALEISKSKATMEEQLQEKMA